MNPGANLMLDPIGGFSRIKDFFISYVETSFRISDDEVAKARRALLESTNVLAAEPYLEPVPRYEASEKTLEEIAAADDGPLLALSPDGRRAFAELALSGLFDGEPSNGPIRRKSKYAPYKHQVKMLERGVQAGHPGIVTSGTGSGKTESFMLPVLAALANEAVRWAAPAKDYLRNDWWAKKGSSWSPRRQGERRPAAVRALILYPMNALVEDQMVRMRRTLDSDEARAVMDDRFAGNRIFFAQYTSTTPVTGHETHPRMATHKAEKDRRARRLSKLRSEMQKFGRNQDAARLHDAQSGAKGEQTRYIFPSLDGGEMVSRWDMHDAPPDVMVTNASMLGAMLSREVEDAIFDKTRKWLESDESAYFYLIFDELHLIRGSSGTEIAFLIKSLIERLGLGRLEHRHKLRILASSASLPIEGDGGIHSKAYLRDLFAPFGTSRGAGDPGAIEPEFWADCVVEGSPKVPEWLNGLIDPAPFVSLMEAALGGGGDWVAKVSRPAELSAAIADAAAAMGAAGATEDEMVKNLAESAAAALTHACRDGRGVRATAASEVMSRLFSNGSGNLLALRGLMLARALPESGHWKVSLENATPAFRMHTFMRNVEGLFASVSATKDGAVFGDLTVERGLSHAPQANGEKRGRRLFELLYCDACGDLLIGGQRGQTSLTGKLTELLPSAANLENLPERAANEYYDDMDLEEFAVFWPRRRKPAPPEKPYDHWDPAYLNPQSGVVEVGQAVPPGCVAGYLYFQTDEALGTQTGGGMPRKSAQPFCCPKCGTDYSNRPANTRRSPIRAFRTGVSKASQLVATELFELLHAIGADPKGICFSDSRQDAANQALETEKMHLRDLRREVLVGIARNAAEKIQTEWLSLEEFQTRLNELSAQGKDAEMRALVSQFSSQQSFGAAPPASTKVKLSKLLQHDNESGALGALVAETIRMGIHPFDEAGRKKIKKQNWWHFFDEGDSGVQYAQAMAHAEKLELGAKMLAAQYELIDDVIFANTFFALEETGLAYPSGSSRDDEKDRELDAWLRIFASAYRVRDNRYVHEARMTEWIKGPDVKHKKVRRIAGRVFGESSANDGLTSVLDRFAATGHKSGMFEVSNLYLKISKAEDPFWRCANCERVHLHIGIKHCTRCGERLNADPSGKAEDLWRNNFIGKRILRGVKDGVKHFRLRVEELTGQTDNFADRLRQFKGIFVDGESELQKRAREIDMLSVTTTMEVGIDIGSLQSVYQANMPPQRFNYQQRVGRAGRRGQAFSFVVTFCRGRTHDAYYFAHPKAITGDAPPPPFLATRHNPIPLRLLRKAWLRAAFQRLRDKCHENGEIYPGDELVPPDIHGEYVTTADYYHDAAADWPKRLRLALEATVSVRDSFVETATATFSQAQRAEFRSSITTEAFIKEIDKLKAHAPDAPMGLARFLAEWGLLPMYGMPTRVRTLYLGLRPDSGDESEDCEWSTMSRDLDLAVFEYAPGAILVKDKLKHRVIGFAGSLAEPQRRGRMLSLRSVSHWREAETFVGICQSCGSAKQEDARPTADVVCDDCHSSIVPDNFGAYVTPAAFRTDFRPTSDSDDIGRMSSLTIATVLKEGTPVECGATVVRQGAGATIMRLNDGVLDCEGNGGGFIIEEAVDRKVPAPMAGPPAAIEGAAHAIAKEFLTDKERWEIMPNSAKRFGIISRRQTDALYLELKDFDPRLTLDKVARRGENSDLPTRAAAISATQILVHKAALVLDVAAEEFEAIEPRLRSGRPMLQVADSLVNGSGLCRRLSASVADGRPPHIVELIYEIVDDKSAWPLLDFLGIRKEGTHADQCKTSCYRCIQRYGNRRYHGLLDWRLGLAYLRAMVTPGYACGLGPNEQDLPEIAGWREYAHGLAESVAAMRPGTLVYERLPASGLPCLIERTHEGTEIFRAAVIHPLWRRDIPAVQNLLGADWQQGISCVDTFSLERRPLRELTRLRGKQMTRQSDLNDEAVRA